MYTVVYGTADHTHSFTAGGKNIHVRVRGESFVRENVGLVDHASYNTCCWSSIRQHHSPEGVPHLLEKTIALRAMFVLADDTASCRDVTYYKPGIIWNRVLTRVPAKCGRRCRLGDGGGSPCRTNAELVSVQSNTHGMVPCSRCCSCGQ